MQEGKPMPCQGFCGTVSVDGRLHSNECYASMEKCYAPRIPGNPCRCSPGCRDAGWRLGDAVISDECVAFGWPEYEATKGLLDKTLPVTSGTDAVAALTKPTRVEAGQRRRDGKGVYVVLEQRGPGFWLVTYEQSPRGKLWSTHDSAILADEYLGTVPVPVSAPAGEAPAPGAGELAFADAMALDPSEVEWTCDTLESHAWSSLALFQHLSLEYLRRCRFRLKPAPRPSRVREMVRQTGNGKYQFEVTAIEMEQRLERAVKAMKEAVQRQSLNGGSVSEWLDRAEAEMLKERP